MDINKVLTMAKNLKNHFRVFEELEEFMREAVALQSVVKEFESRKASLEEEIEALVEEKAKTSAATKKYKESKEKSIGELAQGLEKSLGERRGELNVEIEELEAKKAKISGELSTMEKTHIENLNRIAKETANAETTLSSVERRIANIRAKLE